MAYSSKLFKRFNVLLVIRLALVIGNVLLIDAIFGDPRLFFNQVILFTILVFQVYELILFINNTNRELTRFFLAIRHSDFSITFKRSDLGRSFRELHESMVSVIDAYKQVKIEKEAQFHFLQSLVSQLGVGLISLKGDEISLMNPTAERLLGVSGTKNWKLLQQLSPKFTNEVTHLGDTGRKLIEYNSPDGLRFLSIDVSTLSILETPHRIVTLQEINSEIEQKEIEAWHKLIRILTHEIMNSVTPISSLTETMQSLLTNRQGTVKQREEITDDNIADIRYALETIQKRNEGLLTFLDNYRKLTRVPRPTKETIIVDAFLTNIARLMQHELAQKNISIKVSAPAGLRIEADRALVEQVVINLISNSMHALEKKDSALISITASSSGPNVIIEVTDNGKGISEKELPEIFTPFFSTRKDGSGIGLSLSKQIMAAHQGNIKVKTIVGAGTTMVLTFKK